MAANLHDVEVNLDDNQYPQDDGDYNDNYDANRNEAYDEEGGQEEGDEGHDGIMEEEEAMDANNPFAALQGNNRRQQSCVGRMLNCCFGSNMESPEFDKPPDDDFYADNLIELTHGYTAYRLLEPAQTAANVNVTPPLIILLHGMQNASYMWADIAELLADFEQGPQAQVLVFDFYGRGRSPWTGIPISLDLLVGQVKELMDGRFIFAILPCLFTYYITMLLYFSVGFIWSCCVASRVRPWWCSGYRICCQISTPLREHDIDWTSWNKI